MIKGGKQKVGKVAIFSILLICFVSLYFYAQLKTIQNYIRRFNYCQKNFLQYKNQLIELPEVKECMEKGGCYEICGNPCSVLQKTIKLSELFNFYFGKFRKSKPCKTVCVQQCLLPLLK